MKQNRKIIEFQLDARHVQVMAGFWKDLGMNTPLKVRTKEWDRWHLLYTVEGKGLLTWPDGRLDMTPQLAVLLWPHTEYTYQVDPETQHWSQYSVEFLPRSHWHEWLHWPEVAPGIMALTVTEPATDARIRDVWHKTIAIADTRRPLWEDFTLAAAEKILLTFRGFSPRQSRQQQVADPRLQTAIEFMIENQGRPIRRDQIARVAGISPSYLGILFKKHLRTTPQQYLDMLRINTAQRLLRETNDRISQIGYRVGYNDLAFFCHRFRKFTGRTPSEYRNTMR